MAASAHVRRRKFKQSLKVLLGCTAEKLSAVIRELGEDATMGNIMRSSTADSVVRDAISKMLFFSATELGSS